MEIFLTFISAAAFAAFILCFSLLSVRAAKGDGADISARFCGAPQKHALAAAVCALVSFYFLPVGSLPPYIGCEWGGFAATALLALSAVLNLPRGALASGAVVDALAFPTVFCFVWALLALFVLRTGVPGGLGSLGTYAVMPLWSAAGIWGRSGMAFLLALLLCAVPDAPRRSCSALVSSLHFSLCAALVTALLLPWNLSQFVEIGGFPVFLLDFIFFWTKVFVVGRVASLAPRCAGWLAFRRVPMLYAALMLCAALCVFIESGIL